MSIAACQQGLNWLYQEYYCDAVENAKEFPDEHVDELEIQKALDCIPSDNYKIWIDVGMALKKAGLTLSVFENWSMKSIKHKQGEPEEKWNSFSDGKINIGTVFYYAKKYGYKPKPKIEPLQLNRACDLIKQEFKEPRWAVEGILPEGLVIVAGAPKIGKSFLALHICMAVSSGGKVLGEYPAKKGTAVYFALEDNQRRLQDRLKKLGEEIAPELLFSNQLPRIKDGGIEVLKKVIEEHPDCRLIIIDTLQKIRSGNTGNSNAYEFDYATLGPLQQLAISKQVSIMVITHLRKSKGSDDPFDQISGSTAITGAADASWIIQRPRGMEEARLLITGRDIQERNLKVNFDRETCQWNSGGEVEESFLMQGKARRQIIELLQKSEQAMTPTEIANALGKKPDNVKQHLGKMVKDSLVINPERGKYRLP